MRRTSADLQIVGWFSLLAVLIAGPLLGPGVLILLDFPSGARFPTVDLFPLPSSGDLGNAVPLTAVHVALRSVDPIVADKVLFLGPIVAAGTGTFRLLTRRLDVPTPAAVYGATLFAVNPFVYDRLLAGHLYLLLAYATLPWFVGALLREGAPLRRGIVLGIAVAVAAIASIPFAAAVLLLGVAIVVAVLPWRGVVRGAFAAVGTAAALSAYWLVPSLTDTLGFRVTGTDLETYASRPSGAGALWSLASLRGFWRDEFPSAVPHPALTPLVVVVVGLALVGAFALRPRRLALSFAAVGAAGIVLAASTAFESGELLVAELVERFRPIGAFREPQKLLALTSFAYATLGAVGLAAAGRRFGRARLLAAVAIGAVLVYSGGIFWAFGNRVALSDYPADWNNVGHVLDRDDRGRVLVMPWHLYAVWTFTDARITSHPAPSRFGSRTLVADVPEQSVDPFDDYVRKLLRDRPKDFGKHLAALDVRYVLVLREADWWRYGFVEGTRDLRLRYEGARLKLFENQAWRGSTLALDELIEARPPTDRELPVPRIVTRRMIAPHGGSGFVSVAERCTDGLRLGESGAWCHAGAVAAFSRPDSEAPLWAAVDSYRALGYAISGTALAALVILSIRRRRRASAP